MADSNVHKDCAISKNNLEVGTQARFYAALQLDFNHIWADYGKRAVRGLQKALYALIDERHARDYEAPNPNDVISRGLSAARRAMRVLG